MSASERVVVGPTEMRLSQLMLGACRPRDGSGHEGNGKPKCQPARSIIGPAFTPGPCEDAGNRPRVALTPSATRRGRRQPRLVFGLDLPPMRRSVRRSADRSRRPSKTRRERRA